MSLQRARKPAEPAQASPALGQEEAWGGDQQPPSPPADDAPEVPGPAASRSSLAMRPPPAPPGHVPDRPHSDILSPVECAAPPATTASKSDTQNMSTSSSALPVAIRRGAAGSSRSVRSSMSITREQSAA